MNSVRSLSPDQQIIAFNKYFGIPDNSPNPQDKAFTAGIKESVLTFYNVLGVSFSSPPPAYNDGQQPPTAVPNYQQPFRGSPQSNSQSFYPQIEIHHHHNQESQSPLNNPYFWLWLGSRQPTYRTYHRRSIPSVLSTRVNNLTRSNGMMQVAGSENDRRNSTKNEEEARKKLFLLGMCIALADVIATVAATYVTVIAVKQAVDANTQKQKFKQIAQSLQPTVAHLGQSIDDPTLHLQEIGRSLKAIGDREAKCSKYRAISVAALATAGVGAVHVACSAIACSIITGSASLSVSSVGMAALAFFSASCAPPVLIAIATIGAIGTVIYLALQIYNKKAKDTRDAQEGLRHLSALTELALNQAPPAYNYVEPSAPPMS